MKNELTALNAISPVDGRYRKLGEKLADYFSEFGLIKYRTLVEIEYFIALCELPLPPLKDVEQSFYGSLRAIYKDFSLEDAEQVKDFEKITNHDVKAIEYFLKEKFDRIGLSQFKEFIHFGLTSQDITNTAIPYALKQAWQTVMKPELDRVVDALEEKAHTWKKVPMLARTHGQPASPTRLGKEIYVFVDRLKNQCELMDTIPFSAKFGGATGNFNAHNAAYPDIDWINFGNHLVNDVLGLKRSKITTQIEHYDNLAAFCDNLKRINTILIDLNRDIWTTMPHKVNPIDFENSEGNLGVANAILEHLAAKLPISRLQRDLTDSTVSRNIGVPIAHTLIALKSLARGLGKIIINEVQIRDDLKNNWAVVAEGIQTVLRREGYPEPFEALKNLTRTHKTINQKVIADFIKNLDVSEAVKTELLKMTPENYTGVLGF
jgi:adenylosuccinate lyase